MADPLQLAHTLNRFRSGEISAGAACEMAGIDRYAFLDACRQHNIPVVDFPPEELDAEFEWLTGRA